MTKFFEANKIAEAWASATARSLPLPAAVQAYASDLRAAYRNGRVVVAVFELDLADPVLTMAAHGENWRYASLFESLWDVPGVASALGPVVQRERDVARNFEWVDVFELAAFLSRALYRGGAYSARGGPNTRAFELGVACAQSLAGEDPRVAVFTSCAAWCGFFFRRGLGPHGRRRATDRTGCLCALGNGHRLARSGRGSS